jgi:hypothetical protein
MLATAVLATLGYRALSVPTGSIYAVTITQNFHPPVTTESEIVAQDGSRTSLGSFIGGAIGQATGEINDANGTMFVLTGKLMGPEGKTGNLTYQVEAHALSDYSLVTSYPMPIPNDIDIGMPTWTGFGQQMGFDQKISQVLAIAPSGPATIGPLGAAFPFAVWALDTQSKQVSVRRDLGLCTPLSEGYPATVDPERGLFWFVMGDPSYTRKLIAIDTATGATKANLTLWQNASLTLITHDKKSGRLWGVGNPLIVSKSGNPNARLATTTHPTAREANGAPGPLLLVEMDADSGEVLATHDTGLGDNTGGTPGWQANVQPGEAAFDADNGEIVFMAEQVKGLFPTDAGHLHLIRIPVAAPTKAVATPRFCSTKGTYDCPKLLVASYTT